MYSFNNDYSETAHSAILKALLDTCEEQNNSYGQDQYSQLASTTLKTQIAAPTAAIHFFSGGTITNLTFIAHTLKPYQAVFSAQTGHINTHETGAIEATGHKVISILSGDGKLTPELILPHLKQHEDEHWVEPKLVYISNSTELGTIYDKKELEALSQFCRQQQLYLYVDGARLAMALTAEENDLQLTDLARLTDAFYIGGTKNGALNGEALVIVNSALQHNFRFTMKQKGAITAKGWVLGLQFHTLFSNNLYWQLGRYSNQMAARLRALFTQYGIDYLAAPQTNQLFPILPDELVDKIMAHYLIQKTAKPNATHTAVRFCTSWATSEQAIAAFSEDFSRWIKAYQ